MMEMLLQITSTPAKYELEIEHAHLEYQQKFKPEVKMETTPPELKIKTENAKVRIDTYDARKSLGLKRIEDFIGAAADKGVQALNRSIVETVEDGTKMAQIEDGVTINQIVSQKLADVRDTITAFLPEGGAKISWQPNDIQTNYDKGSLKTEWNIEDNRFKYVPGSIHMKIVQWPGVDIKYIGSPMYFPPSSDPEYEAPEE